MALATGGQTQSVGAKAKNQKRMEKPEGPTATTDVILGQGFSTLALLTFGVRSFFVVGAVLCTVGC